MKMAFLRAFRKTEVCSAAAALAACAFRARQAARRSIEGKGW